MKASALGFSLILLMVPLAGCAGSDTDVNVDISSEELQQMIDDNKDDFFNNTTVVVFQEYHNNTTIVNNNQYDNNYNNNTSNNYDQKDTSSSTTTNYINGSEVEYETYVVRLEWDASDYTTEPEYYNPRENNFSIVWEYYDDFTEEYRIDEFILPCSYYHDVVYPISSGNADDNSTQYWNDTSYYYEWWNYIVNSTVLEILTSVAHSTEVKSQCEYVTTSGSNLLVSMYDYRILDSNNNLIDVDYTNAPIFFNMTIPEGTAIDIIQITNSHSYRQSTSSSSIGFPISGNYYLHSLEVDSLYWTINGENSEGCTGFGSVVNWNYCGSGLYGGWDDINIEFQNIGNIYDNSKFTFTMYYQLVPVTAI